MIGQIVGLYLTREVDAWLSMTISCSIIPLHPPPGPLGCVSSYYLHTKSFLERLTHSAHIVPAGPQVMSLSGGTSLCKH